MHEAVCKENPANKEPQEVPANTATEECEMGDIDRKHLTENLRVFMDVYRQGFIDGNKGKKAA